MLYFHACPILLATGSIISPGNFGRIINAAGPQHSLWEREQILEHIRASEFSYKPSRLHACFIFETGESAKFFRDKHWPMNIIYSAEIVDINAPIHHGDFNCLPPIAGCSLSMEDVARRYWLDNLKIQIVEYPNLECREVVTSSPIRICNACG